MASCSFSVDAGAHGSGSIELAGADRVLMHLSFSLVTGFFLASSVACVFEGRSPDSFNPKHAAYRPFWPVAFFLTGFLRPRFSTLLRFVATSTPELFSANYIVNR